jgi:hypothetical protein
MLAYSGLRDSPQRVFPISCFAHGRRLQCELSLSSLSFRKTLNLSGTGASAVARQVVRGSDRKGSRRKEALLPVALVTTFNFAKSGCRRPATGSSRIWCEGREQETGPPPVVALVTIFNFAKSACRLPATGRRSGSSWATTFLWAWRPSRLCVRAETRPARAGAVPAGSRAPPRRRLGSSASTWGWFRWR